MIERIDKMISMDVEKIINWIDKCIDKDPKHLKKIDKLYKGLPESKIKRPVWMKKK